MPYIKAVKRPGLTPQSSEKAHTPGELNYQITCLVRDYLIENGVNYEILSQATAALGDAKTEFERRIVAKYEDAKILENGDVYDQAIALVNHDNRV